MKRVLLKNATAASPLTVEVNDRAELVVELEPTNVKNRIDVEFTIAGASLPVEPALIDQKVDPATGTITRRYTIETRGLPRGAADLKVKATEVVPGTAPKVALAGDPGNVNVTPATLARKADQFADGPLIDSLAAGVLPVALQRAATVSSSPSDEGLWARILAATHAFSFDNYGKYVVANFCTERCCDGTTITHTNNTEFNASGLRSYDRLRDVTLEFTKTLCQPDGLHPYFGKAQKEAQRRLSRAINPAFMAADPQNILDAQSRLPAVTPPPANSGLADFSIPCVDPYRDLCMIELIWSYWHEESMLVQTMKAISRRFQNVRAPGQRDPLANFEVDPLRPLNNFLWGYVEDEMRRLSVLRRAHEYEHHYGISLEGKAVARLRPADRRSKFLESFHNLLHRCVQFFRQDDDRTVAADGFPVLNSVKETHYLIAHGAHNQFGDLPETSRREMLMEQWLLSRPEMRDFLRGRAMVPYPEPWMDAVDAMKALQSWTDVSVVHFHDLAVFGEQLLLSIRYGSWARLTDPATAVNWARFWRPEIQGYIHAYRAATGVDLSVEPSDAQLAAERYAPPSVHLRRRRLGSPVA